MPSGTVTRINFFCSPCGSISATAATGIPFSNRPSLAVTQTCLAFGSVSFLLQILIQGEYISCGCPAWPGGACSAVCAGACAGAGAGCAAFGADLGAVFFSGLAGGVAVCAK